jgi:hypothetical protein
MRINEPRPPALMERGHSKSIRDASSPEFNRPQESLPEAFEILLCLLDGAERRHRLMMKWKECLDDPHSHLNPFGGLEGGSS